MKKEYELLFKPGTHYSQVSKELEYFDEKSNFASVVNEMRAMTLTRGATEKLKEEGFDFTQKNDHIEFWIDDKVLKEKGIDKSARDFIDQISFNQKEEKDIYLLKEMSEKIITNKDEAINLIKKMKDCSSPIIKKEFKKYVEDLDKELGKKIIQTPEELSDNEIKETLRKTITKLPKNENSFITIDKEEIDRVISNYGGDICFRDEKTGNIITITDTFSSDNVEITIYPKETPIDIELQNIDYENLEKDYLLRERFDIPTSEEDIEEDQDIAIEQYKRLEDILKEILTKSSNSILNNNNNNKTKKENSPKL